MGKGTNYVKKPTLLDAIVHSGKLLKHTRDIIKNEKVFDPKRDFQNRLLLKVYDTALDINSKAYTANELRTDTNPGSQMVQIAGISYLDRFDHFMKERLRVRRYLRYMDDFRAICRTEAEGRAILMAAAEEAAKVGLALHPTKSNIVKAADGALFLGFIYRVTPTGRVLMLRDPARVKETRRKYRRLARKIQRGEIAPDRLDASYQGVRACMEKGTNRRLIRRMDDFVNTIKKEIANA